MIKISELQTLIEVFDEITNIQLELIDLEQKTREPRRPLSKVMLNLHESKNEIANLVRYLRKDEK